MAIRFIFASLALAFAVLLPSQEARAQPANTCPSSIPPGVQATFPGCFPQIGTPVSSHDGIVLYQGSQTLINRLVGVNQLFSNVTSPFNVTTGTVIGLDNSGGGGPQLKLTSDGTTATLSGGAFATSQVKLTSALTGSVFNAAQFVTSTAIGSGVNGPQTAQIGLNINHQKINWNNANAAVGELDGLYITARQGGAGSDMGGMLIDVAGTQDGFLAIDEAVVQKLDINTGLATYRMRTQEGGINLGSGQKIGKLLVAEVGNLTTAIQIQNVFGAGYWGNLLTNMRDGVQNTVLTDQGFLQLAGGLQITSAASGVLNVQGSSSSTSGAGAYLMWNKVGGGGATYLLNQKGGGSGGFHFGEVDTSGTVTDRLTIASNGDIVMPAGTVFAQGILTVEGKNNTTTFNGAYLMWNKNTGDGATWLLNQKGSGTGGFHFGETDGVGTVTDRLVISGAGDLSFAGKVNSGANTIIGSGAALATNAALGFVQVATMAGAPTGTVGAAGQAAVVIDTTNKKLCYSVGGGTWECSAAFTP